MYWKLMNSILPFLEWSLMMLRSFRPTFACQSFPIANCNCYSRFESGNFLFAAVIFCCWPDIVFAMVMCLSFNMTGTKWFGVNVCFLSGQPFVWVHNTNLCSRFGWAFREMIVASNIVKTNRVWLRPEHIFVSHQHNFLYVRRRLLFPY